MSSETLNFGKCSTKLINISANLTELPWELKKAVKRWTGQDTYLVAFKLPLDKVKANIIDIYNSSRAIIDIYISSRAKTNTNLRNSDNYPNQDNGRMHLWALRAIENSQMVLNDNDLIDFINIAKNKTWGYLRIHLDNPEDGANIDNSCSNSEIYCMFINRRRNAQKS